jgi:hypothetical protein
MIQNKNIKIFLNYWLGPVIFIWMAWSIYRQVIRQPGLEQSWKDMVQAWQTNQAWRWALAVLLVPANWLLEAIKWRELMRPLQEIPLRRAFRAILAGVAFAVNTPNRIGEYGGRVLYIEDGKRWKAVLLTIVGSYGQLLVTMVIGVMGWWWIVFHAAELNIAVHFRSDLEGVNWIAIILTTISAVFLLGYFRLSWLVRFFHWMPSLDKLARFFESIERLPVRILLRVLGWSLLRYVVFVIQYILLLQSVGVVTGWITAWWLISVLYLCLAVIPTIALAELGIRGQLALFLFGLISNNALGILTASFGIWFINLVLPAIAGSMMMIGIRIFKTRLSQEK